MQRDKTHSQCGSNLVKFCSEIRRKPQITTSSPAVAIFNSQIRIYSKKGLYRILVEFYQFAPPDSNEDRKKRQKSSLPHFVRFLSSDVTASQEWGNAEFPIVGAKLGWGDANSQWNQLQCLLFLSLQRTTFSGIYRYTKLVH